MRVLDDFAPGAVGSVARTAPPVRRGSMRVSPWFGFMRGLLFALWPGMRYEAVPAAQAPTAWGQASRRRRRALLAIIGALSAAAL
jgi:membrane glycosyltransferase